MHREEDEEIRAKQGGRVNNWHPQEWYTPSRFGVDGLVVIEVCACLAFALAVAWLDFLCC
jgi:hypothetical protein